MKKGDLVNLPDPKSFWAEFLLDDSEYSFINLIKIIKSQYGLVWTGFDSKNNFSKYLIIDEKKFSYFYIRHADYIDKNI